MSLEEASSFKKDDAEAGVVDDDREEGHAARDGTAGRPFRSGSTGTDLSSNASSINYRKARTDKIGGGGVFWRCGVLSCMHLPGLSRRRSMRQQPSMSLSEASTAAGAGAGGRGSTVSKVASMERFKYSSSSSGIVFERADNKEEEEEEDEEEGEEEVSAYFDLPLELLRISSVDTESPVTSAFVFDGNRGRGANKVVPEMPLDLDFSFPAPPVFSKPSSPGS
ncbi:hypothetical protein HU200_025820 [Digitaria exilis]|uniref:Uncharacterized protein n=1 Tax=Digitaria exilis TaxID=1010633 RepID=A0A835EUM4_9POAL|nr:hypothetical protein HU200_025820 [Digitaria exilis]